MRQVQPSAGTPLLPRERTRQPQQHPPATGTAHLPAEGAAPSPRTLRAALSPAAIPARFSLPLTPAGNFLPAAAPPRQRCRTAGAEAGRRRRHKARRDRRASQPCPAAPPAGEAQPRRPRGVSRARSGSWRLNRWGSPTPRAASPPSSSALRPSAGGRRITFPMALALCRHSRLAGTGQRRTRLKGKEGVRGGYLMSPLVCRARQGRVPAVPFMPEGLANPPRGTSLHPASSPQAAPPSRVRARRQPRAMGGRRSRSLAGAAGREGGTGWGAEEAEQGAGSQLCPPSLLTTPPRFQRGRLPPRLAAGETGPPTPTARSILPPRGNRRPARRC